MVTLNRIYTRTGDDGTTRLATGEPLPKHDVRVAAYGAVDELNAQIGVTRLHCGHDAELDAMLRRIQNDLFDLGADLATPERAEPLRFDPLRIVEAQVTRLEHEIDLVNTALAPLSSFVLPGGSALSAHLHVARTVCRRAERDLTRLAGEPAEKVSPQTIHYLNRLSDLLFVAARRANDNGAEDVLWTPGANR